MCSARAVTSTKFATKLERKLEKKISYSIKRKAKKTLNGAPEISAARKDWFLIQRRKKIVEIEKISHTQKSVAKKLQAKSFPKKRPKVRPT
jgi:hypothetical protein